MRQILKSCEIIAKNITTNWRLSKISRNASIWDYSKLPRRLFTKRLYLFVRICWLFWISLYLSKLFFNSLRVDLNMQLNMGGVPRSNFRFFSQNHFFLLKRCLIRYSESSLRPGILFCKILKFFFAFYLWVLFSIL